MDSEQKPSFDSYRFVAWLEHHHRQVIAAVVLVAVAAIVIAFMVWQRGQSELHASHALAELQTRPEDRPAGAEEFLGVANQHPRTAAGRQALLLAGEAFFAEERFDEAQLQFEQFIEAHRDGPLLPQAMLGLAAALDAEGRNQEAITRYQEVVTRYPQTSAAAQARLGMARIYETENQSEAALKLYDELSKRDDDWGREATERRRQLLRQHPEREPAPASPETPDENEVETPETAQP